MVVEPTPLSATNPRIASLRRLTGRRKARLEAGRFVVEGPVPIAELLAAGAEVSELYIDLDHWAAAADDAPVRALAADAGRTGVPVWGLDGGLFASVSDTNSPQGALALVERVTSSVAAVAALEGPVLVLVELSDPGNVGTAVRAAEAAGCAGVVFAGPGTDPFGPKAARAAAGSIARLPIAEVADVSDALDALVEGGRSLVATVVSGGATPESVDFTVPTALLVGSEARGLPAGVIDRCERRVTIPLRSSVESINAAMAGAVVLFEAARQRRCAQDTLK